MKHIDRQIRAILKKEMYEEDTEISGRMFAAAKDLVNQERVRAEKADRKCFSGKYIAAAISAVVLAVYPVKAATDYVAARLASVSEEEKEELRTMVYENNKQDNSLEEEAIRYSRELSHKEQERYDRLWQQYQEGNFPQGQLTVLSGTDTADDKTVCYSPQDRYLYLPEHELTEEELLQIIDFYHKLDDSLRTGDAALEYKRNRKEHKREMPVNTLSEAEAAGLAARYVNIMYHISTEGMESSLESESEDYVAAFKTDGLCYSVRMRGCDGALKGVSMDQDGFVYYQDNVKADEDRILQKGEEAETAAAQLLGEETVITDAYAEYKLNSEGLIPHGSVVYLFDLESGDRLRMTYSAAEDTLWGAALEEGAAGYKDNRVKEGEKRVYVKID